MCVGTNHAGCGTCLCIISDTMDIGLIRPCFYMPFSFSHTHTLKCFMSMIFVSNFLQDVPLITTPFIVPQGAAVHLSWQPQTGKGTAHTIGARVISSSDRQPQTWRWATRYIFILWKVFILHFPLLYSGTFFLHVLILQNKSNWLVI